MCSTAFHVAGASLAGLDVANMLPEQHRLLMSRDKMNLASVRCSEHFKSVVCTLWQGQCSIRFELQVRTRAQDLQKTIVQAIFDLEATPEQYDW